MKIFHTVPSPSQKAFSSLNRVALLLALVVASSSISMAQSAKASGSCCPSSSHGWHLISMSCNLPGNTIAITSSPKTQNFLAIASDETGSDDYGIFQLDRNQLSSGWDRVASLSLPGSVTDLIFRKDRFLGTGKNNTDYFIAVSSDSFNWDIVTSPKSETIFISIGSDFISIGSDESKHASLLFPLSGERLEYVTIGDQHFSQRSHSHHITSNSDMYLCIGSDGAATRTFCHSK